MGQILDRLKIFIDYKGIPIATFEKSIGMSNASFGKQLKKKGAIGTDKLENILIAYPELSPSWLMTGVGEMLKPSIDPNAHQSSDEKDNTVKTYRVKSHRKLSHDIEFNSQNQIESNNEAFAQQHDDFRDVFYKYQTANSIPLVSVKAVGGFAGSDFAINENDIEGYYVIPKFRNLNVDFLIEISGDSMMPRFFPGDIIACSIVHNSRFIQWNKPYLIATREDGMIVKRIKPSSQPDSILAVSDNTEYDPFDIPKSDINGLARVVGVIHTE